MTALAPALERAVVELIRQRGDHLEAMAEQARAVGGCEHPVRLTGSTDRIDRLTGEAARVWDTGGLPDGVQHVACKNRRASRCQPCSRLYQGDAFQLVRIGLTGGKTVPDTIAAHPALFITLTAPSFGLVHTRTVGDGRTLPCRARRDLTDRTCEHDRPLTCNLRHDEGDPLLGQALCVDCFDYAGAVLWNALASELWRRTVIRVYRELARLLEIPERQVRAEVAVQYVKVAEYQRRGVVHYHALLRLDAAPPRPREALGVPWRLPHRFDPPPPRYTAELLTDALRAAVARVSVAYPDPMLGPFGAPEMKGGRDCEPGSEHPDPEADRPGHAKAAHDDECQADHVEVEELSPFPLHVQQGNRSLIVPPVSVEAGQGPACEAGRNATLDARPSPHTGQQGPDRAPYPAQPLPSDRPTLPPLPHVDLQPRTTSARWGDQLDIREVLPDEHPDQLAERALTRGQVAGYLAKYATKHTETLGGLDRRVTSEDLPLLAVNPHVHRLVVAAWQLAPAYRHDQHSSVRRLDAWAHQLGYGGHFLTKSRRYSTTFTALRAARAAWQHRHRLAAIAAANPWERLAATARGLLRTRWALVDLGWRLEGDALLAAAARTNAQRNRQAARDALDLAHTIAA